MNHFVTLFSQIAWPAIPPQHSAGLLSVLFQLEQTQWWSPEQLEAEQMRQVAIVLEHAYATVPLYRRRFDEQGLDCQTAATPNQWRDVPRLTRRDIQTAGSELHSAQVPKEHGQVQHTATSGSTNAPVVTLTTDLAQFFWRVLTLREHFWNRRNFSQSFAAIRYTGNDAAQSPNGHREEAWGSATEGTIATGPSFLLNVRSTIEEQTDWLQRINPAYVLSYPSALLGIAQCLEEQHQRVPNLREVRTFGEILEPECRVTLRRVFGVKVVDMYSSQEVGYIAFQCPDQEHYHVQAENLLVEILDDAGSACQPGQIGRVVVTTLHNFAMPLLRYDIGDYAEVGEPCACGRGLPVLKRILGRQRNLLVMPDGQRRWPLFNAGDRPEELPPFYQFQVIQKTLQDIEVLVVRDLPFSAAEEEHVRRYMQQTLGHPFTITVRCVASIPRSPTGKFEDFISQVG